MLGIYSAFYFYFPVLYGVKFSRIYAYIHYTYYSLGQLFIIIPMLWLGYCGQPRRCLDYPSSLGGWHSISSAGHLITVAGVLAFFIMIYDSVRQAKPTIRNTFGVTRFNTRLNFYLFEISRLSFIQRKNFHNFRIKTPYQHNFKKSSLFISDLDTTLFSYQFVKKN
jgi:heme/copper-type cytochrome/quinol oxidase subunit 1